MPHELPPMMEPIWIQTKIYGELHFRLDLSESQRTKAQTSEGQTLVDQLRHEQDARIVRYLHEASSEITSAVERELAVYLPYTRHINLNIDFSGGSVKFDGEVKVDLYLELGFIRMGVSVDPFQFVRFLMSSIESAIKAGMRRGIRDDPNLPPLDSIDVDADVILDPSIFGQIAQSHSSLKNDFQSFESIFIYILFILCIISAVVVLIALVNVLKL